MSLKKIINDLKKYISNGNIILVDFKQFLSTLNSVTVATAGSIISPTNNLNEKVQLFSKNTSLLYTVCNTELEILFRPLNAKLKEFITNCNNIIKILQQLSADAIELYELFLLSMSMEGFLQFDMSEQDLKIYNSDINNYINECANLCNMCKTYLDMINIPLRR